MQSPPLQSHYPGYIAKRLNKVYLLSFSYKQANVARGEQTKVLIAEKLFVVEMENLCGCITGK
jgi:hypothetical protein